MITIPGYHITEQISESTNSIIYRGRRSTDNTPVILKLLNDTYPSPERIARLRWEYEITRELNVDGIVKTYSLETDQQRWILVQEDFGGQSLRDAGLSGVLPLHEFLTLAIQITDIVQHMHQRRIIHKDLNPANIVWNPDTRQLKLIDFGIARLVPGDTRPVSDATGKDVTAIEQLEGTLAYLPPEQAGRMKRAVDYRSDFYALGVTLYELLTGCLPFMNDDPLELLHCHLAKQPVPPHQHRPATPETVSAIILKLMAKDPDDRYQSAHGLKSDLERCLHQIQHEGHIIPFALGQHDMPDRFVLPQTLYGRTFEIDSLLALSSQVRQGRSRMVLLSGDAGIGKSALGQQVLKQIARQPGYVVTGAFDQSRQTMPCQALIQAFRSLVQQMLSESTGSVGVWQDHVLNAVGMHGQVLIDVLPELALIIGEQPAVATLDPIAAQNRFLLVFQKFIQVFARPDYPLTLFLDDIQQADTASLRLIELLLTRLDSRHLLLIGAYRTSEITDDHPLASTTAAIQQAGAPVDQFVLAPLVVADVCELLAITLHADAAYVRPLAEVVVAKTGGNPFFVHQFLKELYADGLITCDYAQGHWVWHLEQIQSREMTDNLVTLLMGIAQRLTDETQEVLKLAACIGTRFDLGVLAALCGKSLQEMDSDLWEATMEELVIPPGDVTTALLAQTAGSRPVIPYRFAHERIRQAMYALMPPAERDATHWRIGSLLLAEARRVTPEDDALEDELLFAIVNHLNQGRALIDDEAERYDLARLNALAGTRASAAASREHALNYLQIGVELSGAQGWQAAYDLTLKLHQEYARSAYLHGQIEHAEETLDRALAHATSTLDQAHIYNIRSVLYTHLGRLDQVIAAGLQGLHLLGLHLDQTPEQAAIEQEAALVRQLLGDRPVASLVDLPRSTEDPVHQATMHLLTDILIAAWWRTNHQLLTMATLKMVNLSIQVGNTDASAFAYVWYGMFLGSAQGDYARGYEFSQLAAVLNERFACVQLIPRVNCIRGVFVDPWRVNLPHCRDVLRQGYQVGLEVGDLIWAGIDSYTVIYTRLIHGDTLDDIYEESQSYLELARRNNLLIPTNMLILSQQYILCLKGLTRAPASLSDSHYQEERHIAEIRASGAIRPIYWYHKIKLQALYLFEYYTDALRLALEADSAVEQGASLGNHTLTEHYLYYSLTLTKLYHRATSREKSTYWETLQRNQEQMQLWAYHCPQNSRHKYLLVAAEMAFLNGQTQAATMFYDQAISAARDYGHMHHQALANELAARFLLAQEQPEAASSYLREARNGYMAWGAAAKVKLLDRTYGHLLADTSPMAADSSGKRLSDATIQALPLSTSITTNRMSNIDLATVMRAAQAICSEVVLEKLLTNIMPVVMEHAGAQRGCLLLEKNGQWVIEAAGATDTDEAAVTVLQAVPVSSNASAMLPISIINYVARTLQAVVLDDASAAEPFQRDHYIITNQPRSVLCVPLISQEQLIGLLYMENNLTTNVFTIERMEILTMLAAQAAISIQNARLYATLQHQAVEHPAPTAGSLHISGQHQPMLVVRQDGQIERHDPGEDDTVITLQPGDGIIWYTRSVIEATDGAGKAYGLERLCASVRHHWGYPATHVEAAVLADVHQHMASRQGDAELTLLVVQQQ